jgi:hypothetical protein
MVGEGLYLRLFLTPRNPGATWVTLPTLFGLHPHQVAWPLIVIGTAWFGALSGMWLDLRWGWKVCLVLASLCLFFLGGGTFLAIIILVMLWSQLRTRGEDVPKTP